MYCSYIVNKHRFSQMCGSYIINKHRFSQMCGSYIVNKHRFSQMCGSYIINKHRLSQMCGSYIINKHRFSQMCGSYIINKYRFSQMCGSYIINKHRFSQMCSIIQTKIVVGGGLGLFLFEEIWASRCAHLRCARVGLFAVRFAHTCAAFGGLVRAFGAPLLSLSLRGAKKVENLEVWGE
jgi:virulence-associated protein VapD